MLITMLLSLLNGKLYKYVLTNFRAFAITYIITLYTDHQAAESAFERLLLND